MYRIYTSAGKLRTITKWDAQSRLIDGRARVYTSGPSRHNPNASAQEGSKVMYKEAMEHLSLAHRGHVDT